MNNIQKATAATAIAVASFTLGNITSKEDTLVPSQVDTVYVDQIDTVTIMTPAPILKPKIVYNTKTVIKHDTVKQVEVVEVPSEEFVEGEVILDTVHIPNTIYSLQINVVSGGPIQNKEYKILANY